MSFLDKLDSFIDKHLPDKRPKPPADLAGHKKAVWGEFTIPSNLETRHFMAAGASGTGKSALIRILLRSVLPNVLNKDLDTRALIYDAKSEAFPDLASLGLAHETIVLNPFDSRCTAWDIGRDIQDAAQTRELAAVMVPPAEGANKYFYDASRLLLEMAATALIKLRGQNWSFRDLLLACANVADLKKLVENAGLATGAVIEDFLTADKEARAVRMTLAVENSSYNVIAAAWERSRSEKKKPPFSIQDWVAGKGPQILLVGTAKQARTALATVNRLLIQRVQQLLLDFTQKNEATGRRTWVFLDEFPTLGTIPYLEEFLTEGRSRGVCTVLGFQHIAHVQKWYRDLADALLGQCLHQAYFRSNDATMSRWSAANFGRLISYDYEHEPRRIAANDPAATENTFMYLNPATREDGFQCIIRSADKVLPNPRKITVPPRDDLAAVTTNSTEDTEARFVPWKEPLELEPWSVPERDALGLTEKQEEADGLPYPANELAWIPQLSSFLPTSPFWNTRS